MRTNRQNQKGIFGVILDVIFPSFCIICDASGQFICHECRANMLKRTDKVAATHRDSNQDISLDGIITCVEYNRAAAKILWDIKYNFYHAITGEIAGMMRSSLDRSTMKFDYLVPVPLSRKRLWWRGFNQSELLARKISSSTLNALSRTTFDRPQVGLNRRERLENVKQAFSLEEDVGGKTLVLVDDVMTTGATLEACAEVLKEGGAERVYGLVWARDLLKR